MRVEAEKERAVNAPPPAVAADGLADREHVPFVEGRLERRAAMPRRAERDSLGGYRGIGDRRVIGRDQPGDVAAAYSAITQRVRSWAAALPGKSEAVCPSSPNPRRTRSMRAPGAARGGPAGVLSRARSVAS